MTQVFLGSPARAREVVKVLGLIGVDRIAFSIDALGRTTVFVGEEHLEDARLVLEALEQVSIVMANQRVRDAMAFCGGREIGGTA